MPAMESESSTWTRWEATAKRKFEATGLWAACFFGGGPRFDLAMQRRKFDRAI